MHFGPFWLLDADMEKVFHISVHQNIDGDLTPPMLTDVKEEHSS